MAGGMEEKMNIEFIVLSMKVKAFQKYQAYENKYIHGKDKEPSFKSLEK